MSLIQIFKVVFDRQDDADNVLTTTYNTLSKLGAHLRRVKERHDARSEFRITIESLLEKFKLAVAFVKGPIYRTASLKSAIRKTGKEQRNAYEISSRTQNLAALRLNLANHLIGATSSLVGFSIQHYQILGISLELLGELGMVMHNMTSFVADLQSASDNAEQELKQAKRQGRPALQGELSTTMHRSLAQ